MLSTARSGYDELMALIKNWNRQRRTRHAITPYREATGAAQRESSDISENRSEVTGLRVEAEVMLALEAAGTGTFRWDMRTNIITWDDVLDCLFGVPSPIKTRSLDQFITLVHPDDRPAILDRSERCRAEGEDFDLEFRVIWPDGQARWFHGRGKTSIEDGRPAYLTGACFDITERKTTELRRGSELLAQMSHEIRSPMTTCLPATIAEANNAATFATGRPKGKILLVDDNQMVCQSMARLLEISGHEVAVAFDGQSAIELAAVFQPDAFVLDLKLPDMSGHELLRRLKALQSLQHAKSIALTGFGEEFSRSDDVEFDHFLTKPVDAKELETLVLS